MRDKGLRHAELRLAIQQGEHASALAGLKLQLESAREDTVETRRAGELAMTAYAAALCEDRDLALALVDEVEPRVKVLNAEFLLDFAIEMLVRTLQLLGETDRGVCLRRHYLTQRGRSFPRPLAEFYTALNVGLS
jgi:hypothetical protein